MVLKHLRVEPCPLHHSVPSQEARILPPWAAPAKMYFEITQTSIQIPVLPLMTEAKFLNAREPQLICKMGRVVPFVQTCDEKIG